MKKVVFLDRDGVINQEIGDYVFRLEDFVLNAGLEEALSKWHRQGYCFAIVTNQGGISKGLYSKKEVAVLNDYLRVWFSDRALNLLDIFYCPHHNKIEQCICRKPNSLMLERIIARNLVDLKASFLIGDSPRDIASAEKVGLRAILIKANTNLSELIDSE